MKALISKRAIWFSTTSLITFILFTGISTNLLFGGSINNQGTMIIKGNLVNNNTTPTDLGSGTFEFSGSSPQTISGPNQFTNLTINNSTGVSLTGSYDNQVNGTLTLTNGLLTLGTHNLLMGTSATVGGTPSATAMVVVTGTGELRKAFPTSPTFPKDFTYPVGDADGTAEYSPVAVHFTAGTFSSGNYLGVSLKNVIDPALPGTPNDYLKRYWTLNNNGITGTISCGLTFTFVNADIHGNSNNIYCLKTLPVFETYNKYVSPSYQLTGTVTAFSRFTGASDIDITPNITAEPNVMNGLTNFNIIVKVTELKGSYTSGLITVYIPRESRISLTWDPSATSFGIPPVPVNNSVWSYNSSDPTYHIFTTTTVIPAGGQSSFGFNAVFNPQNSKGTYTITSQITSWSGGENNIGNNVDAESVDYFIN